MLQSPWAAFQMLPTDMDTSVTSFFLFFNPANSILHISRRMMILLPRLRHAGSTLNSQLSHGKVCQEMMISIKIMKLLLMLGPEAKDPPATHWCWWTSFCFQGRISRSTSGRESPTARGIPRRHCHCVGDC